MEVRIMVPGIKNEEFKLLIKKAKKCESPMEFAVELTQGYLQPIETLQRQIEIYQQDLQRAEDILLTAKSEITKRDAQKVIKDRNKKIKKLIKAIEGHEIIQKIYDAGFSLEDFYNLAINY